jgi:phenylacetate-coenzyme A ligase PaaK-like adenylate-forming protein
MDRRLETLLEAEQYTLTKADKQRLLLDDLNDLTALHYRSCEGYRRVIDVAYGGLRTADTLGDVPYLPVGLFKEVELRSVPEADVIKVMHSSGTTSQQASRVFLDVETARLQTVALSSIVTHLLGTQRRPMLIVDDAAAVRDRTAFSARGAGIVGMMSYGRDHCFVLDTEMRLQRDELDDWLAKHRGEPLLIFGFTSMVWEYLWRPLQDAGIDLADGVLFHSGGWKKLHDRSVSNATFKASLGKAFGLERIYNFYGMVEQVGAISVECTEGFLHPPNVSDVLVRDPRTWEPSGFGEPGVIEVLSPLPLSYPGHALLTEDVGTVHGEDDCACGRRGKYFTIAGRVPKAEIRGCSDTHEIQRG